MNYPLALLVGTLFAFLFLYARNNRHWVQPEKYWTRMLAELNREITNEDIGVTYKFGDVLLLLPLQAGPEDKWGNFNLSKYLSFVADMLYKRLEESGRFSKDHAVMRFIKHILTYETIALIMDTLLRVTRVRYLHTEVYLGGGWTISALGIGVRLRKLSKQELSYYDVYRYEGDLDCNRFLEVAKSHWNKPYDSLSMSLNGTLKLFGVKDPESQGFTYNTPETLMCSEFGARLFNEATSRQIFPVPEKTTPDDFATLPDTFTTVYYNPAVDRKPLTE